MGLFDREGEQLNRGNGWISATTTGLALGVLAALLNVYVLVPVYGSLTLHLGLSLALLALLAYGLPAGLIAAFLSGLSLALVLGDPPIVVLHVLEVGAIGLLVKRRMPLVVSALFYWAAIGLPLSYMLAGFTVGLPEGYKFIAVAKQAINGLLNASIASALYMTLSRFMPGKGMPARSYSLYQQVFSLALVCLFLPSLSLSLILTNRSVSTFAAELDSRLIQKARDYALQTEQHIERHLEGVALLAEFDRSDRDFRLTPALSLLQQNYPGFLTLLVTDADGRIIHGVPESFYRNLQAAPPEARNVADRSYFQQARHTGTPFVSQAFQGRGFGDDPIVAVSAPLYDRENRFSGVVEGSLDLPNFSRFEEHTDAQDEAVIVLDQAGRIVYASEGLELQPLAIFDPDISQRYNSVDVPQFVIGGERFLYETFETERGWAVHALNRSDEISQLIRRDMLLLVVSLVALIALFVFVSQVIARRLTQPIEKLRRQVGARNDGPIELPASAGVSPEVQALADALEEARQLQADFRHRLEEEVSRKTEDLENANLALRQLASEDPLTRLLNRRGFQTRGHLAIRTAASEGQSVALAFIDIDHFKSVNDEIGHPGGDECLKRFAGSLREVFGRTSDIVARTGGEEFAVLVIDGDCQAILARLERLREAWAESAAVEEEGEGMQVTFSAGFLCQADVSGASLDGMIERCDELLYASKRAGRNRITSRFVDAPGETDPDD